VRTVPPQEDGPGGRTWPTGKICKEAAVGVRSNQALGPSEHGGTTPMTLLRSIRSPARGLFLAASSITIRAFRLPGVQDRRPTGVWPPSGTCGVCPASESREASLRVPTGSRSSETPEGSRPLRPLSDTCAASAPALAPPQKPKHGTRDGFLDPCPILALKPSRRSSRFVVTRRARSAEPAGQCRRRRTPPTSSTRPRRP
jgi:hypothetical protein